MDTGDDTCMDLSSGGAVSTTSSRACDSCRSKKIKCDRGVPCSNCQAGKLNCITTLPATKAQRQRVHISEEYEKKIDRIEDRLGNIENVLASLATQLSNLDVVRRSVEINSQASSNRASSKIGLADSSTPATFEGVTTINSQSDYARKLLTQAISGAPSIGYNAEIKTALKSLGELVNQQAQNNAIPFPPSNHSLAQSDMQLLDRPPWKAVKTALDLAFKHPTVVFAVTFPFGRMKNLRDIVEEAYQNPNSCSAARRIIAYGVMENIFTELNAFPPAQTDISKYGIYTLSCRQHLDLAISQLDMLLPACYENIMALVVGSARAVEMCKPSLCWLLISSATGLAHSLGYHRINTMSDDTEDERDSKIHVYWMIYLFDKTLSLRLGRASVIQDWDITLPYILPTQDSAKGLDGTQMLSYWVKVARVQGQIYKKLFCPAAFQKSMEERTLAAIQLVDAMNIAWFERNEAAVTASTTINNGINHMPERNVSTNSGPAETSPPSQNQTAIRGLDLDAYMQGSFERVKDIFFHSDVVMHYSTNALIQRAVSGNNAAMNEQCLQSSRASLAAHMRANSQFNRKGNEELWSGYVHWSILQAPFTPYMAILCNAIQNGDPSDLPSLAEFVQSLESCRNVSDGADRLYKMCHLLLHVVKLYIRLKPQDVATQSQPEAQTDQYYVAPIDTTSSFDPYLSALGLIPGQFNESNSTMDDSWHEMGRSLVPETGQDFVQNWFTGSRNLMNLMESGEDLQMPDFEF